MEATFSVGGYPVTFTPYMAVPPEGGEAVYCLRVDSPSGEFRGLIFDSENSRPPGAIRLAAWAVWTIPGVRVRRLMLLLRTVGPSAWVGHWR